MQLFLGILIGFFVSFFTIKRSINKTGYGQLKMCRDTCPYYKSTMTDSEDEEDQGDDK